MFHQGGPIDKCTYVPVSVAQYSAEIDYNAACTAVMDLSRLIILNNELMNKDTYIVPEQAPLVIVGIKSAVSMYDNGKYTKHTMNILRRMRFVSNSLE